MQELVYRKKQANSDNLEQRTHNLLPPKDALIRSTSHPELGSLIGVPANSSSTHEMGSTPNLAFRMPSSSQPSAVSLLNSDQPELLGVPHEALNKPPHSTINTAIIADSPKAHNGDARELQYVPTEPLQLPEQMETTSSAPMTLTQAALVSLSQSGT